MTPLRCPMNRPLMILSVRETSGTLTAMEEAVVDRCREHGLDCLLIPHLYHLSESSHLWQDLAVRVGRGVLLCWLHPRPAEWILRRRGIARPGAFDPGPRRFLRCRLSLCGGAGRRARVYPAGARRRGEPSPGRMERFQEPVGRRWYPVLDGSRCVHCQHCLQFCLFGVYELDAEGKVAVGNPDRCKPGCPACSRICPQSAIMFPLYEKDAAIAGAPGRFVTPDAARRTHVRPPKPGAGPAAVRRSGRAGRAVGPADATETLIVHARRIPDRIDGRSNLDRRLSPAVRRDVGGQPDDHRAAGAVGPPADAAGAPPGKTRGRGPFGPAPHRSRLAGRWIDAGRGGRRPRGPTAPGHRSRHAGDRHLVRRTGRSGHEQLHDDGHHRRTDLSPGHVPPVARRRSIVSTATRGPRSSWAGRGPGRLPAIRPPARNWASTTSSPAMPRATPPRSSAA